MSPQKESTYDGWTPCVLRSCVVLVAVAWTLLTPSFAEAHDPYETTTTVRAGNDQVQVTTIMARATAEELLGPGNAPQANQPWNDNEALQGFYSLRSGEQQLTPLSARGALLTEGRDEGDYIFHFEFSPPLGRSAELEARYLETLEQGYTGVVQVLAADSGEVLAIKVLHSSDSSVVFSTPWTDANALRTAGTDTQPQGEATARIHLVSMFLWIGVEHVVFGHDHLLFLLGVILASTGLRQVIGLLTTFTVAHSVTLTLAAFHIVPLANEIVEPLIAASIAIAAFWGKALASRGLLLPMTFAFGLIHGLGFASGLKSLVDTEAVRLLSLLGFNFGVELGQLGAALLVLPLLRWGRLTPKREWALERLGWGLGVAGTAVLLWRVMGKCVFPS